MQIELIKDFFRIYAVDCLLDEIEKLFNKSETEKNKYLKFLYAQLHKIEYRRETVNFAEPIKYKDTVFYSIRKPAKKNTRVLYFYMKDDRIVLLTAFDEKGSSDYEKAKKKAYNRIKNIEF